MIASVTAINASVPIIVGYGKGRRAVKDAKAACSIMAWKDKSMIDTLAAAYAILILLRGMQRKPWQ
jgi:hypothetical protein